MQNFTKRALCSFLVILTFSAVTMAQDYSPAAVSKYNEGIKYSRENNYDLAIDAFYTSIKLDPNFLDSYYNLGVLYEYTKQYDKALDTFKALLSRNPEDDEAKLKVAQIYQKKGDLSSSLSYVNAISKNSEAYNKSRDLYKLVNEKVQQQNSPVKTTPAVAQQKMRPASTIAQLNASKLSYKGFQGPTGIVKDKSGYLYVANYSENSIIRIDPKGNVKTIIKGTPVNGPIGLAVDHYSNLYIANYADNKILRITPGGKLETVVSNVQKPYFLYVDNQNYLFVSEQGSGSVLRYKL